MIIDELTWSFQAQTSGLAAAGPALEKLTAALQNLDKNVKNMAASFDKAMKSTAASSTAATATATKSANAMATAMARNANTAEAARQRVVALNAAISKSGGSPTLITANNKAYQDFSKTLNTAKISSQEVTAAKLKLQAALNSTKSSLEAYNQAQKASVSSAKAQDAALLKQENALARVRLKYEETFAALKTQGASDIRLNDLTASFQKFEGVMKGPVLSTREFNKTSNELNASFSKIKRASNITSPGIKSLSDKMTDLSKSVQVALGPLSGVASRLTALTALANKNTVVIAGVIGGIIALGAVFSKATSAGSAYESQMLRIQAVLDATGNTIGMTASQIDVIAKRVGAATLTSQQLARDAAVNLLAVRNISSEIFESSLLAAQGLSLIGRGDITTNVRRLAKVLEDPMDNLKGMTEQGINFNEVEERKIRLLQLSGDLLGAQKIVLDRLNPVIKAAVAEGNKLAGSWDLLKETITTFLQDVATSGKIVDTLTTFINGLVLKIKQLDVEFTIATQLGNFFNTALMSVTGAVLFLVKNIEFLIVILKFLILKKVIEWALTLSVVLLKVATNAKIAATAFSLLNKVTKLSLVGLGIGIASYIAYLLDFGNQTTLAEKAQGSYADALKKSDEALNTYKNTVDKTTVSIKKLNMEQTTAAMSANDRAISDNERLLKDYKDQITNVFMAIESRFKEHEGMSIPGIDSSGAIKDAEKAKELIAALEKAGKVDLAQFYRLFAEFKSGKRGVDELIGGLTILESGTDHLARASGRLRKQLESMLESDWGKEFLGASEASKKLREEWFKLKQQLAELLSLSDKKSGLEKLKDYFLELRKKLIPDTVQEEVANAEITRFNNEYNNLKKLMTALEVDFPNKERNLVLNIDDAEMQLALMKKHLKDLSPYLTMKFDLSEGLDLAQKQFANITASTREQAIATASWQKEQEILNSGDKDKILDIQYLLSLTEQTAAVNFDTQYKQSILDLERKNTLLVLEVSLTNATTAAREAALGVAQDELAVQTALGTLTGKLAEAMLKALAAARDLQKTIDHQADIRDLQKSIALQEAEVRFMFQSEKTRSRNIRLAEKQLELMDKYGVSIQQVANLQEFQLFKELLNREKIIEDLQVINEAFDIVFSGVEDRINEFVKTGQLSFKGLADSIVQDIFRVTFKASVIDPLRDMVGGYLGSVLGTGGNLFAGLGKLGTQNNPMWVRVVGILDSMAATAPTTFAPTAFTGLFTGLTGIFGGFVDSVKSFFGMAVAPSTGPVVISPMSFTPLVKAVENIVPQFATVPQMQQTATAPSFTGAGPLLDMIAKVEAGPAGYNSYWKAGTAEANQKVGPQNLTGMTMDQVQAFQKQSQSVLGGAGEVGRYQFSTGTLAQLKDQLGISGNTLFDENTQNKLAEQLAKNVGPQGMKSTWFGLKDQGTPQEDINAAYQQQFAAKPVQAIIEPESLNKLTEGITRSVKIPEIDGLGKAVAPPKTLLDASEFNRATDTFTTATKQFYDRIDEAKQIASPETQQILPASSQTTLFEPSVINDAVTRSVLEPINQFKGNMTDLSDAVSNVTVPKFNDEFMGTKILEDAAKNSASILETGMVKAVGDFHDKLEMDLEKITGPKGLTSGLDIAKTGEEISQGTFKPTDIYSTQPYNDPATALQIPSKITLDAGEFNRAADTFMTGTKHFYDQIPPEITLDAGEFNRATDTFMTGTKNIYDQIPSEITLDAKDFNHEFNRATDTFMSGGKQFYDKIPSEMTLDTSAFNRATDTFTTATKQFYDRIDETKQLVSPEPQQLISPETQQILPASSQTTLFEPSIMNDAVTRSVLEPIQKFGNDMGDFSDRISQLSVDASNIRLPPDLDQPFAKIDTSITKASNSFDVFSNDIDRLGGTVRESSDFIGGDAWQQMIADKWNISPPTPTSAMVPPTTSPMDMYNQPLPSFDMSAPVQPNFMTQPIPSSLDMYNSLPDPLTGLGSGLGSGLDVSALNEQLQTTADSFSTLNNLDINSTMQGLVDGTKTATESVVDFGSVGIQPLEQGLQAQSQSLFASATQAEAAGAQWSSAGSLGAAGATQLGTSAQTAAPQVTQLGNAASTASTQVGSGGGGMGGLGGIFGMLLGIIPAIIGALKKPKKPKKPFEGIEGDYGIENLLGTSYDEKTKEVTYGITETINASLQDSLDKVQKFHDGYKSDEFLAFLKKDETVLTSDQVKESKESKDEIMSSQSHNYFTININGVQNPRDFGNSRGQIEAAMAGVLKRSQRNT